MILFFILLTLCCDFYFYCIDVGISDFKLLKLSSFPIYSLYFIFYIVYNKYIQSYSKLNFKKNKYIKLYCLMI
jgi:hypothetical protein